MEACSLSSSPDLSKLKYASLQGLAKQYGLKANLKAEKLRECLRLSIKSSSKLIPKKENINEMDEKIVKTPPNESKGKRVRRRTFELNEALMGTLTPEITSDNENKPPGLDAKNPDKNIKLPTIKWKTIDDENKADKNAGRSKRIALKPQRILKAETKIPRPSRVMTDKAINKKSTPNFARIHKRIFDKMESVDVYVEKKRFRAKQLQSGLTPSKLGATLPKPPTPAKPKSFVPTVFSVQEANFNFTKNAPVQFQASKIPVASKRVDPAVKKTEIPSKKARTDHREMYKTRKIKTNPSETKLRQYVKGVRTNRRFDLQMKLRSGSN